jgi:hypothetical protein
MKKDISLKQCGFSTLFLLSLLGCDGRDRFEDCFLNGNPVPQYEITAYDAVSGERVCWTEYHDVTVFGQDQWTYEGICHYTFASNGNFFTQEITVTAPDYEEQVAEIFSIPGRQCTLSGEQEIVNVYLTPVIEP